VHCPLIRIGSQIDQERKTHWNKRLSPHIHTCRFLLVEHDLPLVVPNRRQVAIVNASSEGSNKISAGNNYDYSKYY
jgi:hypothetical protein